MGMKKSSLKTFDLNKKNLLRGIISMNFSDKLVDNSENINNFNIQITDNCAMVKNYFKKLENQRNYAKKAGC